MRLSSIASQAPAGAAVDADAAAQRNRTSPATSTTDANASVAAQRRHQHQHHHHQSPRSQYSNDTQMEPSSLHEDLLRAHEAACQDTVDSTANLNQQFRRHSDDSGQHHHHHHHQHHRRGNSNATFTNFTTNLLSNLNLGSTIRRRFCSTYSKNLDVQSRPRLIKKSGELNIMMHNVPKHKRRLLSDFFNTILDIKWRWHIVIFLLSFFISWLVFASVWYMIAFWHGDLKSTSASSVELYNSHEEISQVLDHGHLPELEDLNEDDIDALRHGNILPNNVVDRLMDNIRKRKRNETIAKLYSMLGKTSKFEHPAGVGGGGVKKKRMPCVFGVHDFTSALLYSVETQHTIGYGLRHITEECSFAIIFLMVQSCFGIFVQGLVAGVVFAKISRPVKRKRTIIFSHNAVVSKRDDKLCFMFKLANIRTTQLSDARIKLLMIKSRRTSEGEFIPFQSYVMKVSYESLGNDSVFFPCPKTVEHVIDEESPLYELCKDAIVQKPKTAPATGAASSSSSTSLEESTETEADMLNTLSRKLGGAKGLTAGELMDYDGRHEDFEIVVILEGNIETTGASCHIRTSYLPQEILFGYRFMPIYPKFTDFEYLFDYSKFDQVEPCQFELMHLNKAHFRPQMKHIIDATRENKNTQLTYQNTIKKQHTTGKYVKTEPSLASIVAAFKAQASKYSSENENQPRSGHVVVEKANGSGKLNGEVPTRSNRSPGRDQIDATVLVPLTSESTDDKPEPARANFNYSLSNDSNQQTITTQANDGSCGGSACYNNKLFSNMRSGRFTIVPVAAAVDRAGGDGCSKASTPESSTTKDLCELEAATHSDGSSEAKLKSLNEETNSSLNMVSSTNLSESLSWTSDDYGGSGGGAKPQKKSDQALENGAGRKSAEASRSASKLQNQTMPPQLPKHVLFRLNDHNASYYEPRSNDETETGGKPGRYRVRTNSLPVQFQFKNKQSPQQS